MNFIKGLYEARMLRDASNAKVLSYTDCCERVYLSLLILELMRQYPKYQKFAKEYTRRTSDKDNYKIFRMHGTDLYNLIYFVIGDEDAIKKLKDSESAKKVRSKTTLPLMAVNRYLSQVANDQRPTSVSEMLIKVETALHITNSDYKSIRRFVTNLKAANDKERSQQVTRLVFAARAKLRNSDLIDDFEKLVAERNLESSRVVDPEPTISVPDLTPTSSKLLHYQYIVGKENIMLTRLFMQYAKDGGAIPSQYVRGYLPAIQLIDDIVSAGPAYINALKALHQRAKKARK